MRPAEPPTTYVTFTVFPDSDETVLVDGRRVPRQLLVKRGANGAREPWMTLSIRWNGVRWCVGAIAIVPAGMQMLEPDVPEVEGRPATGGETHEITPDVLTWCSKHLEETIERAVDALPWNLQQTALDARGRVHPQSRRLWEEQGVSVADQRDWQRSVHRRQRRRWITRELLAEVTEVYQGDPRQPTKAVQEHFQVSPATASRWVKTAREEGFLAPRKGN